MEQDEDKNMSVELNDPREKDEDFAFNRSRGQREDGSKLRKICKVPVGKIPEIVS